MVTKTAAHPVLQHDGDLKLFLESEAFNVDIKHKEKQTAPVTESKGMFGSLGFGSSLTTKFIENDEVHNSHIRKLSVMLIDYSISMTASNISMHLRIS